MTAVLKTREAIEAAAAILRSGQLPPRPIADRIATALDAAVVAITLSEDPDWPFSAQPVSDRVEA